jgi:hypothetical protein
MTKALHFFLFGHGPPRLSERCASSPSSAHFSVASTSQPLEVWKPKVAWLIGDVSYSLQSVCFSSAIKGATGAARAHRWLSSLRRAGGQGGVGPSPMASSLDDPAIPNRFLGVCSSAIPSDTQHKVGRHIRPYWLCRRHSAWPFLILASSGALHMQVTLALVQAPDAGLLSVGCREGADNKMRVHASSDRHFDSILSIQNSIPNNSRSAAIVPTARLPNKVVVAVAHCCSDPCI